MYLQRQITAESADQFRDRLAVVNYGRWATVEVVNKRLTGINAHVVVDGGQEVAGAADPFNGVFTAFVGGTNETAGLNSTARPNV